MFVYERERKCACMSEIESVCERERKYVSVRVGEREREEILRKIE